MSIPEEQPKRRSENFITVQDVIAKMGLDPAEELAARVEGRLDAWMEEYFQTHGEYPPINAASDGLISVAQVISDMGLEPTPELVREVEQAMIKWFEHEFRDVVSIDDGGVSCYYRYGNSYHFREELFRKKIEEIVRVVRLARVVGPPR